MESQGKGMHHVGLATHDMEATLDFYERVLGFPAVVCEMIDPPTGGTIRHGFVDAGRGELFAFMEANDVRGVPADYDAGINKGLGIRGGMFHFAFRVDDTDELAKKRDALREKGVEVTDVVDHGWCKSIYFHDPNGLQLEFCVLTQVLGPKHVAGRESEVWKSLARR